MAKCRNILAFIILLMSFLLPQTVWSVELSLCNSNDVNLYLETSKLKFLNIEVKKSRKWVKNYVKMAVDGGEGWLAEAILDKYKKYFKATIVATFDNGLICNFKAKVKVTGDFKDHIKGAPLSITSLNVKLLNGNINSVVKFKLLLPHTRGHDNEIFVATLFKNIDVISPQTYYVPALFNGIEITYIFQEKQQKELLESFKLREAPILEGNERYLWSELNGGGRFNLARLVNDNWAEKGTTSLEVSQHAVAFLNKAYLKFLTSKYRPNGSVSPNAGRLFDVGIVSNGHDNALLKNYQYRSLLVALLATHGLSPSNRGFYFDPIYGYFLPIYYDGNSSILDQTDRGIYPIYWGGALTQDEITGAPYALLAIKNINKKMFLKQLLSNGITINMQKLDRVLQAIEKNLNVIATSEPMVPLQTTSPHFGKYDYPKRKLIFTTNIDGEIEVCDFMTIDCRFEKLNQMDYAKILNGNYTNQQGDEYLFIGDNKQAYLGVDFSMPKTKSHSQSTQFADEVNLVTFGDMTVEIDSTTKLLKLRQTSASDRALIYGGELLNWAIEFNGVVGTNLPADEQRFDQNLLTGCVTLLDIEVAGLIVKANEAPCEDGVNFMRTSGVVERLDIQNAQSDALDLDYSNLAFNQVNISHAGNDCIDVSAGNYKVENAVLNDCGDKAISVGEAATAEFTSISVRDAETGVAAKDSSIANIGSAQFNQVTTCLSATRKKQEYWGGKITIGNYTCPEGSNFEQVGSLIEVAK